MPRALIALTALAAALRLPTLEQLVAEDSAVGNAGRRRRR